MNAEGLTNVALAWLVLGCSMLIGRCLTDVLRYGDIKMQLREWQTRRKTGGLEVLPAFSLPLLATGVVVTTEDLMHGGVTILFVDAAAAQQAADLDDLRLIMAAFSSRDEAVYVLCNGTNEECRALVARTMYGIRDQRVLLDSDGSVTRMFGIRETPAAYVCDADGRVVKYGYAA